MSDDHGPQVSGSVQSASAMIAARAGFLPNPSPTLPAIGEGVKAIAA